jgi:hypothetical protein
MLSGVKPPCIKVDWIETIEVKAQNKFEKASQPHAALRLSRISSARAFTSPMPSFRFCQSEVE